MRSRNGRSIRRSVSLNSRLRAYALRARYLTLTGEGLQVQQAGVQAIREVSQLTPEMLGSGEWRSVKFRPYDIELATEPRWIGKRHPLQRVIGVPGIASISTAPHSSRCSSVWKWCVPTSRRGE